MALTVAEDTQCSFLKDLFYCFPYKVAQTQAHDGAVFVETMGVS